MDGWMSGWIEFKNGPNPENARAMKSLIVSGSPCGLSVIYIIMCPL